MSEHDLTEEHKIALLVLALAQFAISESIVIVRF